MPIYFTYSYEKLKAFDVSGGMVETVFFKN